MKKQFPLLITILVMLLFSSMAIAQDKVDTVKVAKDFPFSFKYILGETGETKHLSKVGRKLENGLISPPYEYIMSNIILIGEIVTSNENKYYKAYYHGKQFYISAKGVRLNDNMQPRLDSLASSSDEIQKLFNEQTIKNARYLHLTKLENILDCLKKHKKSELSILDWGIYDESQYTEGTGFKINVLNPTNKTIKYITITLVGYNPVDDKVLSRGKYTQTVKCVGPIKPENSGSYSFEYVWFTDMVENAKITSITVQYMDGSVKTITNAKSITWNSDDFEYYKEEYPELEDIGD